MIKTNLLSYLKLANPWLDDPLAPIFNLTNYIQRSQFNELIQPRWDSYITVLTGPRQVGKTTLGKHLSQHLLTEGRYEAVLYLNCDEFLIREWLTGSHVLDEMMKLTRTRQLIVFIDEVQRLNNPGLLLKSMFDLQLPIKLIATGSSQLELKSQVQEFLTGRHLEAIILPVSVSELVLSNLPIDPIYGSYPKITQETQKSLILQNLYQNYINKDLIEILKIRYVDVIKTLLTLIAHSSGQLVNYQQLACDLRVSSHTVQHYLSILEQTYVLSRIQPFVGNKRSEITSNPIYYFIDNGFRNQALNNFLPLEQRTDMGLLIESFVFQELYKFKTQHYLAIDIHFWRTKSGAEVDFVLYKNEACFIPIEVKYTHAKRLTITRSYRSFIEAYQPKLGLVISKECYGEMIVQGSRIVFIPFSDLKKALQLLHHELISLTDPRQHF